LITRNVYNDVPEAINETPAVALLGPRQVGKTTLALEVGNTRPSLYLDLESASDRAKLFDPSVIWRSTKTSWSSWTRCTGLPSSSRAFED
jgi:predicted AAA+ superfamily ATPase